MIYVLIIQEINAERKQLRTKHRKNSRKKFPRPERIVTIKQNKRPPVAVCERPFNCRYLLKKVLRRFFVADHTRYNAAEQSRNGSERNIV